MTAWRIEPAATCTFFVQGLCGSYAAAATFVKRLSNLRPPGCLDAWTLVLQT